MASSYVGRTADGWVVVIDGVQKARYGTQLEAERAFNDLTGQKNTAAPAATGTVSDAAIVSWAQGMKVSVDTARAFVKANGRLPSTPAEFAAFQGTSPSTTPATTTPSGYAPGQEAFNPGVYAAIMPLIQQAYNEERLRLIDLPGLQIQKDSLALNAAAQVANQALGQANLIASLRGPKDAFKQMEVMAGLNAQGGSKLLDAVLGGGSLPAFQAPQAQPVPASIGQLVHDSIWMGGAQGNNPLLDQYQRITGQASTTAAPMTQAPQAAADVQGFARNMGIDPRLVQGYVDSHNGQLPTNTNDLNTYLNGIGARNPQTGALTGVMPQAAAPATPTTQAPAAPVQTVAPVTTTPHPGAYGISGGATIQPIVPTQPGAAQPGTAPLAPPTFNGPAAQPGAPSSAQAGGSPLAPPSFGATPPGYSVGPTQPVIDPLNGRAPQNPGEVYDAVLFQGQAFKQVNGRWPTPDEWTSIYGHYMTPLQAAAIVQRSQDFQSTNGRSPSRDEWTNAVYRSPTQLQFDADVKKASETPLNKINVRAYAGAPQSGKDYTQSVYEAIGYSPADVQDTIAKLMPQFNAPIAGTIR